MNIFHFFRTIRNQPEKSAAADWTEITGTGSDPSALWGRHVRRATTTNQIARLPRRPYDG